jgi:CMP-N,N'-diacetyllegionaminic acid synthase
MLVRILVLLTGRQNSSLPRKNMLEINGKPCIYYPIMAARKALGEKAEYYCSSDSDEVLQFAQRHNYTSIKRPLELALDTALHVDVLNHSLDVIDKDIFDAILVLLANAPVIHESWIKKSITLLSNDLSLTSVIPTIIDQDHHPYRAKVLDDSGLLRSFFPNKASISSNRQSLPDAHFPAHNFWLIRLQNGKLPDTGDSPWGFFGDKVAPIQLPVTISDIHTKLDQIKIELEWSLWN